MCIKKKILKKTLTNKKNRKALQETRARAVFLGEEYEGRNNYELIEEVVPYLSEWPFGVPLKVKQFPNLKMIVQTSQEYRSGFTCLRDLAWRNPFSTPQLSKASSLLKPSQVSSIFYLQPSQVGAGAEAEAEAVSFSHSALVNNAFYFSSAIGLDANDRVLSTLPLWTSQGFVVSLLSPFSSQAYAVIPSALFDEDISLKKLYEEQISVLSATPSQWEAFLSHPNLHKMRKESVKKVVVASERRERASPLLLEKISNSFNVPVHLSFSVDRFAGVSFLFSPNKNWKSSEASLPAGHLLSNMEAQIVDSQGNPVALGKQGTLLLKGHNLFSGIYRGELEPLLPPPLQNGFYNTNLQAKLSENGLFHIFCIFWKS